MPWANLRTTLIIENHGTSQAPRYKLSMFVRQTLPSGATYLEPLPISEDVAAIAFAAVEFVQAPGTKRDASAGELALTHAGERR